MAWAQQIQVLLLGIFWKFFSQIFLICLVEYVDAEPLDMEG